MDKRQGPDPLEDIDYRLDSGPPKGREVLIKIPISKVVKAIKKWFRRKI